MAKNDIASSTPFEELLTCVSLCVVPDAQIADWIKNNSPLSQEHGFQLVQTIELTKGDRELSHVLADALKQIGGLRAA
jgi:hypothetical protein